MRMSGEALFDEKKERGSLRPLSWDEDAYS